MNVRQVARFGTLIGLLGLEGCTVDISPLEKPKAKYEMSIKQKVYDDRIETEQRSLLVMPIDKEAELNFSPPTAIPQMAERY